MEQGLSHRKSELRMQIHAMREQSHCLSSADSYSRKYFTAFQKSIRRGMLMTIVRNAKGECGLGTLFWGLTTHVVAQDCWRCLISPLGAVPRSYWLGWVT